MAVALSVRLVAHCSDLITFCVTSLYQQYKVRIVAVRQAQPVLFQLSETGNPYFLLLARSLIWAAAVQSCSEPVVGLSQRCAKVNELFDDLVRILWDTARLMHPRPPPMHRQRPQPRWWTDECFQALVAKNAAWRDFRRSTSQPTMPVSPIVGSTSTGLSVQPVAVFGDPGKTTFRGCALRTLRRVPVASGGVSVLRPAAPLLMTP